jgi:4-hydroxyphenylpyruvate dioxygenase
MISASPAAVPVSPQVPGAPRRAEHDSHGNPLGVRSFHHIEFWVDDARAWAEHFRTGFGLQPRAYGGPETGLAGRRSHVVGQGRVNYVFTQAEGSGPEADAVRAHLARHGNGVRDVAFRVRDAAAALAEAVRRGAKAEREVTCVPGWAAGAVRAYGDTVHSLVQRDPGAPFAPGYADIAGGIDDGDISFAMIDHVVANVERMDEWVAFYREVFGFDQTAHFDIRTKRSSLMSKVVGDEDGYVKLPINEPSSRNSQIQEFLDEYRGPGVQHIALLTPDIVATVREMRRHGVKFMTAPETYFDEPHFSNRVGGIKERVADLKELGILVDRDRPDGYLLQIFTDCQFDRPTLFHEIIQRRGNSDGFGEGNFQALFEAIEREQARRGSL